MVHNTHSSEIIPHETVFIDSSTESDGGSSMGWPRPDNQLGLEYRYGVQQNEQVEEALDSNGEIQQCEQAEDIVTLPRQ